MTTETKPPLTRFDYLLAEAVELGIFTKDEAIAISALVHFHDGSSSDMPDTVQEQFDNLMEPHA